MRIKRLGNVVCMTIALVMFTILSGVSQCNNDTDLDLDGWTVGEGDCDDDNAAVYPGATEVCNEIDDNCDGLVDEDVDGDGQVDNDFDGYTACQGDCNSSAPEINPGATEVCNNADDNCNGAVDEGYDQDNDSVTICADTPDCDDTNAAVYPGATEMCDTFDNDCNDTIDDRWVLHADQATDNVMLSDMSNISLDGSFTIEAMVHVTASYGGGAHLFGEWNAETGVDDWGCAINYAGKVTCFIVRTDGTTLMLSGYGVGVNEWVHFAMVRDTSLNQVKLYVGGYQISSTHDYNIQDSHDGTFYLNANTMTGGIIGEFDYFRVSSSVRYYGTVIRPIPEQLVTDEYTQLLWSMDAGAGDVIEDASGNGNDGSNAGLVWQRGQCPQ